MRSKVAICETGRGFDQRGDTLIDRSGDEGAHPQGHEGANENGGDGADPDGAGLLGGLFELCFRQCALLLDHGVDRIGHFSKSGIDHFFAVLICCVEFLRLQEIDHGDYAGAAEVKPRSNKFFHQLFFCAADFAFVVVLK